MSEEHKEHEHHHPGSTPEQQQAGQQQAGGFKPKKIRHKMYGTKTATTEAEYTASKADGWEDDDEPSGSAKQPPKTR